MKYAKLINVFDGRLQVALMAFKNSEGEYPSLKASYIELDGSISTIELVPEKEKTLSDYEAFFEDDSLVAVLESVLEPRISVSSFSESQARFASIYEVEGLGQVVFLSELDDTELYFLQENETVCSFGLHGVGIEGMDDLPDHQKHYYIEMAQGRVPVNDEPLYGNSESPTYLN